MNIDASDFFIFLIVSLFILFCVSSCSYESAQKQFRIEAVKHNAAEYVTEKGLPVWKWKE